jgi:hypothetical protein
MRLKQHFLSGLTMFLTLLVMAIPLATKAQCPINWQLNTIGWTDGFNGYIPGSMVTATASYSNFNNFAITTPFTTGVQTGIHTAGHAADCPSCFDLANPVSGGIFFMRQGLIT